MTHATTADEAALNLSPRAKLEILGAILLALFLFALDQTVVGTALPRIVTDLHGNSLYTWAVTIYLLTATISGPIYGKLSDLFGRRPIVFFAAVFGVSSLVDPGIGGFITDTFSWHWIFFINIPIGLISLFILWRLLP